MRTCVPSRHANAIRTSAKRWYSKAGLGLMCVIKAAKALVPYALLTHQRGVHNPGAPACLYTRKKCDRLFAGLWQEASKEQFRMKLRPCKG